MKRTMIVSDGIKCGKIWSYNCMMVEAGRDSVGHIQEDKLTVNFLTFNMIISLKNRIFLAHFYHRLESRKFYKKKCFTNLSKDIENTSFFSSQIEYVIKK